MPDDWKVENGKYETIRQMDLKRSDGKADRERGEQNPSGGCPNRRPGGTPQQQRPCCEVSVKEES